MVVRLGWRPLVPISAADAKRAEAASPQLFKAWCSFTSFDASLTSACRYDGSIAGYQGAAEVWPGNQTTTRSPTISKLAPKESGAVPTALIFSLSQLNIERGQERS
jgi:hypothetical protein